MALTTTTTQEPIVKSEPKANDINHTADASMLAAVVLSVYAAQKSRKQLRRLKRKALLALFKYRLQASFARVKSIFSKNAPANISNRTLLYILLGIAVIILLFISWPAAVVLLLLGILLVLLLK